MKQTIKNIVKKPAKSSLFDGQNPLSAILLYFKGFYAIPNYQAFAGLLFRLMQI
ncbi:hypothetical protein HZB89_00095 [archaeon]|nr:hypothetical protein [archaeon]